MTMSEVAPHLSSGEASSQAPMQFEINGERLVVRRSWPGKEGVRIYECSDSLDRIRAVKEDPEFGVKLTPYARDRKLPSLQPGGDLIVHRAGKRAVERTPQGFVKHLRTGKSPDVAAATATMSALAGSAGFAVPRILGTTEHSVTLSTVPGRPLIELNQDSWELAWDEWSAAWARMVLSDVGGAPGDWELHDAAAEVDVVRTWFGNVREYDAGELAGRFADRLTEVEHRVCQDLLSVNDPFRDGAVRDPVPAHRDLHDGQMLFDSDNRRVGLLDFDTAVLADRELDLANLDAHMELRVMQGLLSEEAAYVARVAIGEAARLVGADPDRMEIYREATRARLVCVYAFRPQWIPVAERLLERLG